MYVTFGGFLFLYLERENEQRLCEEGKQAYYAFLHERTLVARGTYQISEDELRSQFLDYYHNNINNSR